MDYVSYLHQRLLIEEQLRRDLVAQEWLASTRQVGNVNTGNVGVYEATNAFANSRIDPLVSRNSYPGIRHPLLSGIPVEPAKKKQKAKVATLPRFTLQEGVAHSFPLPHPTLARPIGISSLSGFQELWDSLNEDSKHVRDAGQRLPLAKEIFARRVVRLDPSLMRSKLKRLTALPSDASGCDAGAKKGESTRVSVSQRVKRKRKGLKGTAS
jgi:hypothetical protein